MVAKSRGHRIPNTVMLSQGLWSKGSTHALPAGGRSFPQCSWWRQERMQFYTEQVPSGALPAVNTERLLVCFSTRRSPAIFPACLSPPSPGTCMPGWKGRVFSQKHLFSHVTARTGNWDGMFAYWCKSIFCDSGRDKQELGPPRGKVQGWGPQPFQAPVVATWVGLIYSLCCKSPGGLGTQGSRKHCGPCRKRRGPHDGESRFSLDPGPRGCVAQGTHNPAPRLPDRAWAGGISKLLWLGAQSLSSRSFDPGEWSRTKWAATSPQTALQSGATRALVGEINTQDMARSQPLGEQVGLCMWVVS